jgi:hypothetical protein
LEIFMSQHRIDQGYAMIKREADGTSTVSIGRGVQDGQLFGMFAQYVHVTSLAIGPDVRLDEHADASVTATPVAVFRKPGGPLEVRFVS